MEIYFPVLGKMVIEKKYSIVNCIVFENLFVGWSNFTSFGLYLVTSE